MYDWTIAEHLHTDLVQVFFFTSGNGVLLSAQRRITLNTPCVVLIPTNTLHGFAFQSDMVGEVFTITEQALERFFKLSPRLLLELNRLHHFVFDHQPMLFQQLLSIREKICQELENDHAEKQLSLQLLLQWLWVHLYRLSLDTVPVPSSDNRTLRYFDRFQKRIRQSVQEVQSVQEYARELNITTVHLNRICQSLVKKSALQIIHEYVIDEAKKYLLSTTLSLSEISYLLNFRDPAYFSRLFKKQTGYTPGEFRKQVKQTAVSK